VVVIHPVAIVHLRLYKNVLNIYTTYLCIYNSVPVSTSGGYMKMLCSYRCWNGTGILVRYLYVYTVLWMHIHKATVSSQPTRFKALEKSNLLQYYKLYT